jgi:hypothetical protein
MWRVMVDEGRPPTTYGTASGKVVGDRASPVMTQRAATTNIRADFDIVEMAGRRGDASGAGWGVVPCEAAAIGLIAVRLVQEEDGHDT